MKIDDLLSRADDQTLQTLLGGPGLRLVSLLDPGLASPSKLQQLIIDLYSREGLLITKETRQLLLDFLPNNAIKELASVLKISTAQNTATILEEIKRIKFSRGSKREKVLFDFFELEVPEIDKKVNIPSVIPGNAMYSLFSHQRRAIREVKEKLKQGKRRVLLHMPTGSGKTRTAMNVIADHLRSCEPTVVVWLAFSEELCEQAASEFENAWKYLGDRPINIYRFWGSHTIDPKTIYDGVVFAGLSKAYNAARRNIEFISDLGKRSSLVVIDEAHSSVAETYSLILEALIVHHPSTGLLGLTATPGRTWNEIDKDEELARFFNRTKVSLQVEGYDNPVDYLVAEKYLAKAEFKPLFFDGGLDLSDQDLEQLKNSLEIPDHILRKLAESEKRNLMIILEAERLAKAHKRIIVFATTVDHADLLATVLRARGFAANSITSRSNEIQRRRIIEDYKDEENQVKIICNFGVLTTGFDAPQTSAAIIARPTKSLVLYSQMIGRAIRGVKAGGNEKAEIVTVVDQELPGFKSVSDAFTNWEDIWE